MLIMPMASVGLVNLDSVEMIFTENDECDGGGCLVIARGASGGNMPLGWYRDEARAQEVVLEIAETYKRRAVEVDTMNFIIRADSSIVYEMPRV